MFIKKIFKFAIVTLLFSQLSFALEATLNDGRKVNLYSDGTWIMSDNAPASSDSALSIGMTEEARLIEGLEKITRARSGLLDYELKIISAKITEKGATSTHAENSGELRINVAAMNMSKSSIVSVKLAKVGCSDGVDIVCWDTFRGKLYDSYGNNLSPDVINWSWIGKQKLYPGEKIIFTVTGDRPVSNDGSFNLIINGIHLNGKATKGK